MAPHLPARTKEATDEILMQDGVKHDLYEIAAKFNTTYEAVRYRRLQIRIRKAIGWDPRKKQGTKPIITEEMGNALLELLINNNDLYLDEIADFLWDTYGVDPSASTLSRWMASHKIAHKRLKVLAQHCNQELVNDWYDETRGWQAEQVVCIDEVACNERTGERRYGWACTGMEASIRRVLKRTERWSCLPAYTIDGWITAMYYQGGFKGWMVHEWLKRDVIPLMNAYPGP